MKRFLPLVLLPSLAFAATVEDGLELKRQERFADAEAAFTEVLAAEPANVQALAERATVRGWQKKYPAAIADWKLALAHEPENAGYHLGLARVLNWAGDRPAAIAELDRVLLLRPRDAEVWELKGDIARADGNRTLALTAYREADRLDPQDRVSDRIGREEAEPRSWRIDVGGMRDAYTQVRETEQSGYAAVGYAHDPGTEGGPPWTAGAGTIVEHRFDELDVAATAEGSAKVADWLRASVRGGYTPDADFLYDWKVGGGVEIRPARRFALLFDIDHSRYEDNERTVLQVAPGAEFTIWRLTFEARYRGTVDHAPGLTGKGDAAMGRVSGDFWGVRTSLAYLQGREPDPPFPIARVKAVWGSIEVPLNEHLSLRGDAAFEHREDPDGGTLYNRTSLGGGLILRF